MSAPSNQMVGRSSLAELVARFESEPTNHSLAYRIALLLARRGEYRKGMSYLEAAIQCASGQQLADYLGIKGMAKTEEDPGTAVSILERAISIAVSPSLLSRQVAEVYWNHLQDRERGQYWFRRALEGNPADERSYLGLCETLIEGGAADNCFNECRKLVSPLPFNERAALLSVGAALQTWGRYSEGLAWCSQVLKNDPKFEDVLVCAARAHERMGDLDAAGRIYARMLPLRSGCKELVFNAVIEYLLRAKQWEAAREATCAMNISRRRPDAIAPQWNDEPIKGRSFLLDAAGGFGDMFQYVRFAEKLRAAGARSVTIQCPVKAREILASVDGVTDAVLYGENVTTDFHDALLFLVGRLPDGLRPWYGKMPYLTPPAEARRRWRSRFPAGARARRPRVGLVWTGDPSYGGGGFLSRGGFRDAYLFRAVPFASLTSLFSVPNVDFYSFQYGQGREELSRSQYADRVTDLADEIVGFSETAAALEQLDVLVSTDTAASHLAGAMGRTTLLLLPFCPDCRWAEDTEFRWYPSVRLLRQPVPGDWDTPVAEAKRIISRLSLPGHESYGVSD